LTGQFGCGLILSNVYQTSITATRIITFSQQGHQAIEQQPMVKVTPEAIVVWGAV
jgi:hypothetical protein